MTDHIEPAASDHEWRQFRLNGKDQLMPRYFAHCDHPSFIAKHNDALPESDLRKITREWVEEIRNAAGVEYFGVGPLPDGFPPSLLAHIADALESYLPPPPPAVVEPEAPAQPESDGWDMLESPPE